MFIQKGKKKKAMTHMYKALLLLKLNSGSSPVLYIFEIFESIKPTFKLESCFPRKTAIIYPRVVPRHKQYTLCLHWVQAAVKEDFNSSKRYNIPFWKTVYNTLSMLHSSMSKNPLIKKRDRYHMEAIRLQ